jgi:predicted ester cyclase
MVGINGVRSMSTEENKVIVRRFFELLERERRIPEELFDPGIIYHVPGSPDLDLNAMRQRVAAFDVAISNGRRIEKHMVAEDDIVAFNSVIEGKHTGEFMSIPASNKQFSAVEMGFIRIANEKIVEMWGLLDSMGLIRQISAIPSE